MVNFPYTRDIPATNNDPSDDQPNMAVNTNSTDSLIAQDHFSFGVSNGGLHKQCTLGNRTRIPLLPNPPTGVNQFATLYCNDTISTGASVENGLWLKQGTAAEVYQLTRTIAASNALFGVSTNNYNGVGVNFTGGWTFLPGGLLLQYGSINSGGTGLNVIFPVAFNSNPFTIQMTGSHNNNNRVTIWVKTLSTTQFTIASRDSSGNDISAGFSWMAIGR
jgi:hypothetical protein